ncbi:MAG: hypothetical protein ACK502_08955 [Alphaproteobacteria bacterium]
MQPSKDHTVEELEQKYQTITTLFDSAEELVMTVESPLVKDPEAQLNAVEPLINEMSDAADVLTEEFVLIAESQKKKIQSRANKKRVEAALRKLYVAIHDYEARVSNSAKKAHGAIMNIADPIVTKIKRQVEEVVIIFLEFMQLSLHSLMTAADLDALRVRDARVALMMHQHALSQQQ